MVFVGNADREKDQFQWLFGGFWPPDHPLYTEDVEIKWQVAPAGTERTEWVTGETRWTVTFLIYGRWELEFRDKKVNLVKLGDFAYWTPGEDHRWKALETSLVVTVRWPSGVKGGQSIKIKTSHNT